MGTLQNPPTINGHRQATSSKNNCTVSVLMNGLKENEEENI